MRLTKQMYQMKAQGIGKPDAGNLQVRFDEGGGAIPTSTLLSDPSFQKP